MMHNISPTLFFHSGIQSSVASLHRKSLADFVRTQAREKRLTYREISGRSKNLISTSMVGGIINERYGELSTSTLAALAAGLGVSFDEVYYAAYKTKDGLTAEDRQSAESDPRFLQLVEIWLRIPPQNRPFLIEQAKLLVAYDLVNIQLGRDETTITPLVVHPTDEEIEEILRLYNEELQAIPLGGFAGLGGGGIMPEEAKQTIIRDKIEKRRQELLDEREAKIKKYSQ